MKLLRSFLYAGRGIKFCFQQELNFRIHVLAIVVVVCAGFYFSITTTEWIFVTGCCTIVVAMEMLNTALEKMCDLVTKDFHPLIKCIKDVSAGAVLVCAAGSLLTGTIIFLPKIIQLLK
ncbi:diacylglycerol kinase family protein [soil metagenome]|jgi:undecaprenol kinase